jgi:methanethiol S-methyltransferase
MSSLVSHRQSEINVMNRITGVIYGLICYVAFLISFVYAIGFLINFGVPKNIDSGAVIPLGEALVINFLLLGVFAIQHSVMARPGFKQVWTKIVPKSIERSTYVLLSSLALILIFWQWRPMPDVIWEFRSEIGQYAIYALNAFGWLFVLITTFLINHFDLFGLRQVYLNLLRKGYTPVEFKKPFIYKFVRHPIYIGFIIAFWATPVMTVGHLVFAIVTTVYILIGIQLEERDLMLTHPEYEEYRRNVPMIIPNLKLRKY